MTTKVPFETLEDKKKFWHTSAHVLAQAVLELFPDAKRTIGPPIDEGFYYDFYKKEPFTPEDLKAIQKKMREITKKNPKVVHKELSIKEAKEFFKDNKFKLELIDEFGKGKKTLSFYGQGDYLDLCKGGHIEKVGDIKAIKLLKTSASYWRGDAKKESLQRIYGISFPDKEMLKEYLHRLEEAEKRDHRRLGKELDLFSFHDVSPGSPFFHPKGAYIYNKLQNFLRELYPTWGYQEVITPLIYDKELWEQSGHWTHYKENMFVLKMDKKEASLKPMNCPSHILIFKTNSHSYRDLPIRLTDFAPLHRNELKGTLGGLTRVRKFSQDDCHVFCTPEQVKQEIKAHIEHCRYVYEDVFGFDFHVELSTKPEKAMGDPKLWKIAEKSLQEAIEENGIKYHLNPGDGAFYGPKIDFHLKDAIGRTWQCGTEQLDFQQPENFDLTYEGNDGKKHKVALLHRTVLGSIERFMGILIEHYAGNFPLWLNPNQIILLPMADRHVDHCNKLREQWMKDGLRVDIDSRVESMNKKVRDAQVQKYSLMVTIGDKELENKTLAVRTREGKVKFGVKDADFVKKVKENIAGKEKSVEF